MTLADQNGSTIFSADMNACTAVTFATVQHGQVIDAAGNWHGQPIAGSQTPWVSAIDGNNKALSNVASIQVNGLTTTDTLSVVSSFSAGSFSTTGSVTGGSFYVGGTQVINTSAQFVQAVNTTQGIICGSLSTSGRRTRLRQPRSRQREIASEWQRYVHPERDLDRQRSTVQ